MIIHTIQNVKTKLSKIKINKIIKKTVKQITTFSMISKVVALSLILATAPIGSVFANAKDTINKAIVPNPVVETNVKTQFSQAYPVCLVKHEVNSFNLVESSYNRAEREKREQEDKQAQDEQVQEEQAREAQVQEEQEVRTVVSRDYRSAPTDVDLSTKRALVQRAASAYGIDWRVLEAVWQVESGKSWDTTVASYAGAGGPMQFMPSTWSTYAVDGNGDGVANMYSAEDAVYGAANMLAQNGLSSGDVDSALYSYNHAQWYVDMVKNVANSI